MDSTAERQFSKLDKSTKKRIVDKLDSIVDNQFLYVTRLVGLICTSQGLAAIESFWQ
jgi:mRNA-degrading endonuclease RelE of RelBE toxin-antitoxin system